MVDPASPPIGPDEVWIRVSIARQDLCLQQGSELRKKYLVSTARAGPGELNGSGCTPRGWHQVRAKIGGHEPLGAVFVGRRPTGEIYDEALAVRYPQRDWILTRILWLSGLEPGRNRLGERDTMRRYIYIHGCPDSAELGQPGSHGCIRMRNEDVADLFERVPVGTRVVISE
ncbi:L,D-transpeptidase [Alkalilimnicola ehrlichii]|uniref:L,D-transpeptidase n=1 Tax=Alkalilimnicola ehrlichii TaxID=351052 RepID=A0A3E0WLD8_9GAMM|nr:L,D-transpeptidase [Alkalilimnicola ehrlichii]RFA24652.1 L,D-transpeptidase [Alkalilimnicola ehrlichii]RFA33770.1 L,D-transpeptidase [Alkalilimnicola ehrlichii]